jgi:hypothetical protein
MLAMYAGSKVPANERTCSSLIWTIINYREHVRLGTTFSAFPRREATSLEALMAASFLFGIVVFALISRTGIFGMERMLVFTDEWGFGGWSGDGVVYPS